MSLFRTVLLVSPTSRLSRAVTTFIQRAGCHVALAGNFQSGKLQMDAAPDLVITELKLGEYNGLQLALRGRATGIPVIVLADDSYEHEVEQLGAVWMSPEAAASDELPPTRRGPRGRVRVDRWQQRSGPANGRHSGVLSLPLPPLIPSPRTSLSCTRSASGDCTIRKVWNGTWH
jgi:hypothetical protein